MALGVLVSLCRVMSPVIYLFALFVCMYISGQYYKQVWPLAVLALLCTEPHNEWQGSVFVFVAHTTH